MNTVNKLHQIGPGIITVLVMSAHLNTALLGTIPLSHFIAFFFPLSPFTLQLLPFPPPKKKEKEVMLSSDAYTSVTFLYSFW